MKKMITVAVAAVSGLLVAGGLAAAAETELPVTKITAFSSGVAYFEHNGSVKGDAEVLLKFKAEQINDILKSLVLLDLGGGEIGGMNYASQEPLDRALKNFSIDISGEPSLGQLLRRVRGAEVAVSAPDTISGKILGVETRARQVLPTNTLIQEEFLDLLTLEGMKSVGLETISAIALKDEKLDSELNQALAFLVESRDTNRKPVTLSFRGKGERAVRVGYINEAPVWKTSYRLVLGGKEKDKALLQGWAIVENTSDFDWKNVDLTLISGRPISFVQDLYTPLYATRPVVQPELYASLRPQLYDEGIGEMDKARAPMKPGMMMKTMARERALGEGAPAAEAPASGYMMDMRQDLESVKPAATGAEIGELFSYHIHDPVTLSRSTSAMLPIINQDVEARKVSIYNASVLAQNPLNGLWLANDTGLSLLAGPVTVFDEGTYAGDSQLGNLPPKGKRLLSYAIDLKLRVDSSQKSSQKIVGAKIARGVLELSRRREYTQEYVLKNTSDRERTVVIEHPRWANRKLLKPAEPLEKTEKLYRFETAVPPSGTGKFEVVEEQTDAQTVAILPCDVDSLLLYSRNGEIPSKVREALAEVAKRKSALFQAERELKELEQQESSLRSDQDQVRRNLEAVQKTSQAYTRFEKKLLDLETKVEAIQEQIAAKRGQVDRLRKDLADHIGGLNIG